MGAGIGGLSTAATLRRVGLDVEIYERASELRPAGGGLSLMTNGVLALRDVGVEPRFEDSGVVFAKLHFATRRGRPIRTVSFTELADELGAPSYGIHRADLQQVLLKEIGDTPITLGAEVTGFTTGRDGVTVHFKNGEEAHGDFLVGADGFGSAVRRQIAGAEQPREPGYVCWLATPSYEDPRLPHAYVAHYWGRGKRFGIANIGSGRIYWWGTQNMPAAQARTWHGGKEDILRSYAGWADEVLAVLRATPEEEILTVPAQDRPFLERWGEGPVTLLGDAAHPMLTSVGQGAALAMEDAAVLALRLADTSDTVAALRAYEDERRPRTRKLVELAYSLSKMEQAERPLQVLARNSYFRFASKSALDQHNRLLLDFRSTR
ncbi:NAD(P)/FAD-dependent oxidoreductase [Streptosporangium oxazolinicum]|uniref:NAD(P)/FAD-dependent oxidoreductase n=1 Tax=Streptosporangium oxazolinicum TaxID=909287 RepID=A0ABP8ALH3_9ACTN